MSKKSEKQTLIELADAALRVIQLANISGISVPFIQVNLACGRVDRITEHFNKWSGAKEADKKLIEDTYRELTEEN